MRKRIIWFICACLIVISFCSLTAAAENASGAGRIYTLFNMSGGFIENPIYTSEEIGKPWLLVGKDVFMTDDGGYPASFDNIYSKSSFYYMAGSNSGWPCGDVNCFDHLNCDYVVEYVVSYDENANGCVSMAIAYNYDYYIEVYVSPDGRGDISVIAGESSISALDVESLLDPDDPSGLIFALSGDGNPPDRFAVSIKVSADENKMPEKIEIYVNGLLAGETNASFSESVENLTPQSEQVENGAFPKDKLGNIVALKISPEATGNINNIYIYWLGDNTEPNADAQAYYAEIYGNASYASEPRQDVSEDGGTEIVSDAIEDELDDGVALGDAIATTALILGAVTFALVVIGFIILILRKKYK